MAEQNCSSSSTSTPVIITSTTTERVKSDGDDSNIISNTGESENFIEKNCSSNENASYKNQPLQSNSKLMFSHPTISSFSENRNGVSQKSETGKSALFLRPSLLSTGSSSFLSKTVEENKSDSPFSLKCPKLNLSSLKFGDSSFTNSPTTPTNSVKFGNEKNDLSLKNFPSKDSNQSRGNSDGKFIKSTQGMFSNALNPNTPVYPKASVVSVPNFVFGQNLHERVTDSVKLSPKEKTSAENKSNGTSDMLFASVLKSKEIKENSNNDVFHNSKESSSLIEDAAKYQEARANKRKYEEVLVTTGEEDEDNILQVNVKLFAFDNGIWVERGRGILRLNDKICDNGTSSRIVIRTVGSLRVVLNTKIWNGMSLNRASERSARLTAMDPSGQVKIFLIQASLKDMASLYPLLEDRIKSCQVKDSDNEESPQKKIALEKTEM